MITADEAKELINSSTQHIDTMKAIYKSIYYNALRGESSFKMISLTNAQKLDLTINGYIVLEEGNNKQIISWDNKKDN